MSIYQEFDISTQKDRLHLFKVATAILTAGATVSFLIRFFIMRGSLKIELLLSLSLVCIGVLIRLIPFITKNHTKQNTMFLIVSVLSIFFFSGRNLKTGAVTVWTIYILFLLFAIVLGGKVHALIFVAINIGIQIVFMVIQPKIVIIVDKTDYVTRITIIIFSYFIARYLTVKYALSEERLYTFAYFDRATKLPNKNMLKKNLGEILYNISKSEKIAILDIEIENIWMIDDTYGHAVGEQIIIKSAAKLKDLCKDCLSISRTGEREFVIVLPYSGNNEEIKFRQKK